MGYQAENYQIKLLSYWNISELSIELELARNNSDTILIPCSRLDYYVSRTATLKSVKIHELTCIHRKKMHYCHCRCQIIKSLRISNSYKKVIFLKISNIHSSNCQTILTRLAKLLQDCVFRNYITISEDFTPAAKTN